MKIFSWLYNAGLALFLLGAAPLWLYQHWRYGKYPQFLKRKMGSPFKHLLLDDRPLIWIHAVSVGETKAVATVAELLKKKYPKIQLLITSTTETGHKEAKRSLAYADHYLFLPFDFSWVIRPIVQKLKPDLVLLVETDYWYHFMQAAKANGAKIALLNGKISQKSLERYKWLGSLLPNYFAAYDLVCLQSKRYAERFSTLAIPESKIAITGNLKLDAPAKNLSLSDLNALKTKIKISPENFVLVAGSTHAPEEQLLLKTVKELLPSYPNLKLLLIPRHIERASQINALIKQAGLSTCALSQIDQVQGNEQVILVDAMGLLTQCYQLAHLAIVGGSFYPQVGGHNILEPCAYAVPVLFGPFMHTQLDFVDLINEYQAGVQITPETLSKTLRALIDSPQERQKLGESGLKLYHATQGASQKTLDLLESNLNLHNILQEKPTT